MTLTQLISKLAPASTIHAKAKLSLELIASQLAHKKPLIIISNDSEKFSARLKNLNFFCKHTVMTLPADDRNIMHATSSDPLVAMEKCAAHFKISTGEIPPILLVQAQALLEKFPSPKEQQKHAIWLITNDT